MWRLRRDSPWRVTYLARCVQSGDAERAIMAVLICRGNKCGGPWSSRPGVMLVYVCWTAAPKAGNAVPGCHMPRVPPIIWPVRCRGTLLTPPASFSFLSSPSFALSAGHSAIVGNDVALWGRNGAGGRAACPPRARRTWAAYAPGVSGVVIRNSALLISSPNATLSTPLCTSVCCTILSHLNA
jgi:hypothetical protein